MSLQTRTLTAAALGVALVVSVSATAQDRQDAPHQGMRYAQAPAPAAGTQPGGSGMWLMDGTTGPMGEMSPTDMDRMRQMMQRMGAGRGGAGMPPRMMRAFDRIEGQLAYFRAELRITEAQTPLWNAFADAARTQVRTLRQAFEQAMQSAGQPASAPAHMERHITAWRAMLNAAQAMNAAMMPLYSALSDEQKRTADELVREHMRDHMGGMGRSGP